MTGYGSGFGSGYGYLELCKSLHPPVDSSLPVSLPQARRSGACIDGIHKWMLEHKIDSPSTVGQIWPLLDTDPWVMRILIEATRVRWELETGPTAGCKVGPAVPALAKRPWA